MIVLLPISRYKVSFRTAVGVPHSQFEDLMLRALAQGDETLDALEVTFAIHRRLLIQALVGLIQEGYVALGPEHRYLLTDDGAAVAAGKKLQRVRETPARSTSVVMERLLGLVAPAREVRYVGRRELNEAGAVPTIDPRRHDTRLDPAQVRHLIPRGPDEWVRSIEEVRIISRDANWLPVRIDIESGRIIGLPDRWTRLLAPALIENLPVGTGEAQANPSFDQQLGMNSARSTISDDLYEGASLTLGHDDIIDGADASGVLARVLEETADMVIIATPMATAAGLANARAALVAALDRGVDVHVLACGADAETRRALERLSYDLRDTRLVVAISSELGDLSALVWNTAAGWRSLLGAVAWLNPAACSRGIMLRHPLVVASVAEAVASVWRALPGQALSSVPDRWSAVAADRDASSADHGTGNTEVRLVLGGEAEHLLIGSAAEAGPRVSHEDGRCTLGWWRGEGANAIAVEVVGAGAGLLGPLGR